jgi:predicted transcriptional regulator
MLSTPGLSAPATFVLRSLRNHPDLRLPEAIAAEAEMDVQAATTGVAELRERGLAEEDGSLGWRLTDEGRSAE